MNFKEALDSGRVKRIRLEKGEALSLIQQTKQDMDFFGRLKITKDSARKITSNFYDFLRSVVESMALADGYKMYGHEIFVDYLHYKGEGVIAEKFDRFRELRNEINYRGKAISPEVAQEVVDDIKKAIAVLLEKYLGGLG